MNKDGSSVLVVNQKEILLLLRDNIPEIPHPNLWSLPGGGIEAGESPYDAAIKELEEEVTYSPENLRLLGKKVYTPDHSVFLYLCFTADHERTLFKHTGDEGQEIKFSYKSLLKINTTHAISKYIAEYGNVIRRVLDERYIPEPAELGLRPSKIRSPGGVL